MAEIMLTPITASEIEGRTVLNTGVSTVGRGGNDYFCGHCGRRLIHNMDLGRLETPIVYQCDTCKGYNVAPEAVEGEGAAEAAAVPDPG